MIEERPPHNDQEIRELHERTQHDGTDGPYNPDRVQVEEGVESVTTTIPPAQWERTIETWRPEHIPGRVEIAIEAPTARRVAGTVTAAAALSLAGTIATNIGAKALEGEATKRSQIATRFSTRSRRSTLKR